MDVRRRTLERAAAHGDRGAGARLLLERVRQGELDWHRVSLAAHAGHPQAAEVLTAVRPGGAPVPQPAWDVESWAGSLAAWGKEACVRGAVAAGRLALAVWEETIGHRAPQGPGQALVSARRWLEEPGPEAARRAERAARRASLALVEAPLAGDRTAWLAGMSLVSVAHTAVGDPADRPGLAEVTAAAVRDAAEALGGLEGARAVRSAVRADLLSWSLAG